MALGVSQVAIVRGKVCLADGSSQTVKFSVVRPIEARRFPSP